MHKLAMILFVVSSSVHSAVSEPPNCGSAPESRR
jgi:hypothetical protein